LARAFIADRFCATVVSVDGEQLDDTFVGRSFDDELLRDLPPTADPCGEHGEFHTFVHDGPIFERPVGFRTADQRTDGRFIRLALRASPDGNARV
jgi:diphthamide synthase (EF-2-diphthine--ammonia ligase)